MRFSRIYEAFVDLLHMMYTTFFSCYHRTQVRKKIWAPNKYHQMSDSDDLRSEKASEESYSSEEDSETDNSFIEDDSSDSESESENDGSESEGGAFSQDQLAKMIVKDGDLVGNTAGKQRFADVINKYSKIVEMACKDTRSPKGKSPRGKSPRRR